MRRWLVVGWMIAGVILFAGKAATQETLPADGGAEIPAPRYVALTFDDGPRPGVRSSCWRDCGIVGPVQRSFSLVSRRRCILNWCR